MDETPLLPQAAEERTGWRSATSGARRPRWGVAAFLVFALAVAVVSSLNTPQGRLFAAERLQIFVAIFLGLLIEATPFLLATPVINPVVIFSAFLAFGWEPVLWGGSFSVFWWNLGSG